jgi:hypothetical protein
MEMDKREVTTVGGGDTIKLRIASNAKAFKALIDKLYSDKPRAVVRELWSNAYDAHCAIGKPDLPFDTHVPTTFEPWFSVRDFGPGMDAKFVETLYRTVFESTKDQDNNAVGKWGLGSKSPWAYTDSFTVTCYDGASMRSYSAYIDEDQFPNFKLMLEQPSDEPCGVEVRVPVRTSDIYTFQTAIQRVAVGFDTKPNVGDSSLVMTSVGDVASSSGKDWFYIASYSDLDSGIKEFDSTNSYAWQGCVLYPIDPTLIPNMTEAEEAILSGGFIIRFPIGAIDINPAREGLSYDVATVRALKEATERVSVEVIADQQALVNKSANYYSACAIAASLRKRFAGSPIYKIMKDKLTYRRRALEHNIDLSSVSNRYSGILYASGGANMMFVGRNEVWGRNYAPRHRNHSFVFSPTYNLKYAADLNVTIVWEDPTATVKTYDKRFDSAFRSGLFENVVWIRCKKDCIALKRLMILMGKTPADIFDLSELSYIRHSPTNYVRTKIQAKALRGSAWEDTTVDTTVPTIYLPMSRGSVTPLGDEYVPWVGTFYAAFEAVKKITGSTQERLIGVPKTLSHLSKKGKNNGWVDLRVFVKNMFDNISEETKMLLTYDFLVKKQTSDFMRDFSYNVLSDDVGKLAPNSPARVFYLEYKRINACLAAEIDTVNAWRALEPLIADVKPFYHDAVVTSYDKIVSDFKKAYPMFVYTARYSDQSSFYKDALNYFSMVDAMSVDMTSVPCDTDKEPDDVTELDEAA